MNREIIKIEIEGKDIWYGDRFWKHRIRLIPKDEDFIKKVTMSRNAIPNIIKDLFNLTKKEQEEYNNAKTEEDLAEICTKDVKMKGGLLIKQE